MGAQNICAHWHGWGKVRGGMRQRTKKRFEKTMATGVFIAHALCTSAFGTVYIEGT
jgi:hypothetical protein